MTSFSFAEPLWLLTLLPLLVAWWIWKRFYREVNGAVGIEAFADPHLLPYLTQRVEKQPRAAEKKGVRWPENELLALLAAVCFVLALAGPRMGQEQQQTLRRGEALVLVLDLSRSMMVEDVAPSRMARAKQEAREIVDAATKAGIPVGIVGFAATAHVISPITEDGKLLKDLIPGLDPSLFIRQGSSPAEALQLSAGLLKQYSEQTGVRSQHILMLTDGDLDTADLKSLTEMYAHQRKNTPNAELQVHVMAVGTEAGAPVPNGQGGYLRTSAGEPHISSMQRSALAKLASTMRGIFLIADYTATDTNTLLKYVGHTESADEATESHWVGKEWFLVPLLMGIFLTLVCLPRLGVARLVLVFLCVANNAWAVSPRMELHGVELFKDKKYTQAAEAFHGPYNQGVAYYRAGQYDRASEKFKEALKQSSHPEGQYNLGNSLFMQGDIQAAADAYQEALKQKPDYAEAKYNLDLAQQLLRSQEQQQQQNNSDSENQQQEQQSSNQQNQSQEQQQKETQQSQSEQQEQQDKHSQSTNEQKQQSAQENQKEEKQSAQEHEDQKQQENSIQEMESNPMSERLMEQVGREPEELLKRRLQLEQQRDALTKQDSKPPELKPW